MLSKEDDPVSGVGFGEAASDRANFPKGSLSISAAPMWSNPTNTTKMHNAWRVFSDITLFSILMGLNTFHSRTFL